MEMTRRSNVASSTHTQLANKSKTVTKEKQTYEDTSQPGSPSLISHSQSITEPGEIHGEIDNIAHSFESSSISTTPAYLARSVHYPDLSRDDSFLRQSVDDAANSDSTPNEVTDDAIIRGFMPSAPSFDGSMKAPLLNHHTQHHHHHRHHQAVSSSSSSSSSQRLTHPAAEPIYDVPALPYQPPSHHQHIQPVQILQHPEPYQAHQHPRPHLHPLTVTPATTSAEQAEIAKQERLAYLRSKALSAEKKELAAQQAAEQAKRAGLTSFTPSSTAAPPVRHIRHRVEVGDDLTALAVRYGTTEAQIKSLNRRIVFQVLDNVVGEFITIPATSHFRADQEAETPEERAKREKELEQKRQFLAAQVFKEKAKVKDDAEAEFYLVSVILDNGETSNDDALRFFELIYLFFCLCRNRMIRRRMITM